MLNNQKGITLVALVITIVILIILATVAISFAFGDGSLLDRAQEGTERYKAEQDRETALIVNVQHWVNETLDSSTT